jgi:hypothetical protein
MALKVMKKIVTDVDGDEEENKDYITKEGSKFSMVSKVKRPEGTRYYKSSSPDLSTLEKIKMFKLRSNPADSVASSSLSQIELEKLNKK